MTLAIISPSSSTNVPTGSCCTLSMMELLSKVWKDSTAHCRTPVLGTVHVYITDSPGQAAVLLSLLMLDESPIPFLNCKLTHAAGKNAINNAE